MVADNVELGTACGKLHRVSVLAITDPGASTAAFVSLKHWAAHHLRSAWLHASVCDDGYCVPCRRLRHHQEPAGSRGCIGIGRCSEVVIDPGSHSCQHTGAPPDSLSHCSGPCTGCAYTADDIRRGEDASQSHQLRRPGLASDHGASTRMHWTVRRHVAGQLKHRQANSKLNKRTCARRRGPGRVGC